MTAIVDAHDVMAADDEVLVGTDAKLGDHGPGSSGKDGSLVLVYGVYGVSLAAQMCPSAWPTATISSSSVVVQSHATALVASNSR